MPGVGIGHTSFQHVYPCRASAICVRRTANLTNKFCNAERSVRRAGGLTHGSALMDVLRVIIDP